MLVDHVVSEYELVFIAWLAFGVAGLIGIEVAWRSMQPRLLVVGAVAAAISIVYAAPPIRLSARGLGELAVGLVYGPGIVLGTILLLRGAITAEVIVIAVALGWLIANVLLINEIPDERADRVAGKRTLVVRLGRDRATSLIAFVFTVAFLVVAVPATYGFVPFRVSAMLAAAPVAAAASSVLRHTPLGPPVAAQTLTLATYVIAGAAYCGAVLFL